MKNRDECTEPGTVIYLEFDTVHFEEHRQLTEVDEEFMNKLFTFRINVRITYISRQFYIRKRYLTETLYILLRGVRHLRA